MKQAETVVVVHTHTHTRNFIEKIQGEKAFIGDEIKDRLLY